MLFRSVIGVLATKGTFNGRLYNNTLHKYASGAEVIEQVGDGLVELVEMGEYEGDKANKLLRRYIEPMLNARADHIVLGCTHYPFLAMEITKIIGNRAVIVDPAPAVAKHLLDIVSDRYVPNGCNGDIADRCSFYSTSDSKILKMIATSILPHIPDSKFSVITI